MIGCGDVAEVKSGPALQMARDSELVAVMRRDGARAADYARRHGVPTWYDRADDLIDDPQVSAVYVATPPSSHCELALRVAASGKPCLVEKPMAVNHAECVRMIDAFRGRSVPLFVAYYRRAFPRFLAARELLRGGAIGKPTSVHTFQYERLAAGDAARIWRVDPAVAGAGFFLDLASHGLDLLDFLLGPICAVAGEAVNSGGTYAAEDVTAASFRFESGVVGTGIWNFNAAHSDNGVVITGSAGTLRMPVFTDTDLVLVRNALTKTKVPVESAELSMVPKSRITPDEHETFQAMRLIEALEELEDVQAVFSNLEIGDELMAKYEEENG